MPHFHNQHSAAIHGQELSKIAHTVTPITRIEQQKRFVTSTSEAGSAGRDGAHDEWAWKSSRSWRRNSGNRNEQQLDLRTIQGFFQNQLVGDSLQIRPTARQYCLRP